MVEHSVVDGKVAGSNPVYLDLIKVAQLVEHSTENRVVTSSSLVFDKWSRMKPNYWDNSSAGRAIDF